MAAIIGGAIAAAGALGSAAIAASNKPKSSQTATTQTELRPEATATIDELMQRARAYAAQPYEVYSGQRLAAFTPEQLQAFGLTGDIAAQSGGLYNLTQQETLGAIDQSGVPLSRALGQGAAGMVPGSMALLPGGAQAAGRSGALAGLAPGIATQGVDATLGMAQRLPQADLTGYMNPYTQAVLDPALRDIYERSAQQQNAEAARQARAGSFGGSRGAITAAELERGTEREAGRLSATTRADAFNQAVQQWRADQAALPALYSKALGLTGEAQGQQRSAIDAINAALQGRGMTQQQIAAAQGALSNVAGLENIDLARLGALSAANAGRYGSEVQPLLGIGAQIQAQDQAQKDIDLQNYIEERDWGSRGLQQLQGALGSGVGGLGASTAATTPLNTGNRLAQILGAGMMGGSLFSGQTGRAITGGLTSLFSGSNQGGMTQVGGTNSYTSPSGGGGSVWGDNTSTGWVDNNTIVSPGGGEGAFWGV